MKFSSAIAVLVALAVASMGVGTAVAWQVGPGQSEPSTSYDTEKGMHGDANAASVDKIYFNGVWTLWNTNGLLTWPQGDGGSTHGAFAYQGNAYLGYWRDCNADGYLGARNVPANFGNWETSYPHDLFSDGELADMAAICPSGSPYNDGTWFNEWHPIGNIAPDAGANYEEDEKCEPKNNATATADACEEAFFDQFYIRGNVNTVSDEDAKVWFDIGTPDGQAAEVRNVFERGWTKDSASTLRWLDFWTGKSFETISEEGFSVTVPGTGDSVDVPATHFWKTLRENFNVGHCDEDRAFLGGDTATCGLWPLYQAKRLYNDSDREEDREEPLVYVFDEESDCNANSQKLFDDVEVRDPTAEEDADPLLTVYGTVYWKNVKPDVHGNPLTEGSVTGTVTNVDRGVNNVNRSDPNQCGSNAGWGDNLETDVSEDSGKTEADTGFRFRSEWRTRALGPAGYDDAPLDAFGARTGGHWYSQYIYFSVPPTGGTFTFARPTVSFYASLTQAALDNAPLGAEENVALPNGLVAGEYGEDQCFGEYNDGHMSPGNWICSRERWEKQLESDGLSLDMYPLPGDPFTLRDVDCYDGTLVSTTVEGEDVTVRGSLQAALVAADEVAAQFGLETELGNSCAGV